MGPVLQLVNHLSKFAAKTFRNDSVVHIPCTKFVILSGLDAL